MLIFFRGTYFQYFLVEKKLSPKIFSLKKIFFFKKFSKLKKKFFEKKKNFFDNFFFFVEIFFGFVDQSITLSWDNFSKLATEY